MDTDEDAVISGPMFPHGHHNHASFSVTHLKGTIVGVRPGRKGEEVAQMITVKLDDWEHHLHQLLHTDVTIVLRRRT